jgi:hypothetical protein
VPAAPGAMRGERVGVKGWSEGLQHLILLKKCGKNMKVFN